MTRFNNPLSGHAVNLIIDIGFQSLGDWVLSLAAWLAIGEYPNGPDEGTLITVFRTKDVDV